MQVKPGAASAPGFCISKNVYASSTECPLLAHSGHCDCCGGVAVDAMT